MKKEQALLELAQIWQDAQNYPTSALVEVQGLIEKIYSEGNHER